MFSLRKRLFSNRHWTLLSHFHALKMTFNYLFSASGDKEAETPGSEDDDGKWPIITLIEPIQQNLGKLR